MFDDAELLEQMVSDFDTKILCKLDWEKGLR